MVAEYSATRYRGDRLKNERPHLSAGQIDGNARAESIDTLLAGAEFGGHRIERIGHRHDE